MAKTLANRLKVVLIEIISQQWSAFILDKLISDNILVIYEVLHSMKNRQRRKKESIALELDMVKTYDRVE